ncbi:hypothetical protein WDW86_22245 [Bdellovibrionota bacterium FG-2]
MALERTLSYDQDPSSLAYYPVSPAVKPQWQGVSDIVLDQEQSAVSACLEEQHVEITASLGLSLYADEAILRFCGECGCSVIDGRKWNMDASGPVLLSYERGL